MRQVISHPDDALAVCTCCGATGREHGPYWRNRLKVLDFGVPGLPPFEPDTTAGVRCDACEDGPTEAERHLR